MEGIRVAGSSTPITELDFCFFTLSLALGNECGLVRGFLFWIPFGTFLVFRTSFLLNCLVQVRIYNLKDCQDRKNFHFVTENKNEGNVKCHALLWSASLVFWRTILNYVYKIDPHSTPLLIFCKFDIRVWLLVLVLMTWASTFICSELIYFSFIIKLNFELGTNLHEPPSFYRGKILLGFLNIFLCHGKL